MKKTSLFALLAALTLAVSAPVLAQPTEENVKDAVKADKKAVKAEKKAAKAEKKADKKEDKAMDKREEADDAADKAGMTPPPPSN